jgi:hypothetical protein
MAKDDEITFGAANLGRSKHVAVGAAHEAR